IQLSILAIFIANILYSWSLEGKKDVDWIHHHIGIFGVYIFIASILYFAGFFVMILLSFTDFLNDNNSNNNINNSNNNSNNSNNKEINKFTIRAIASLCLIVTIFQFLSDTDASLERHGQYNLIILVGIEILYTSIALFWIITLRFFKFRNIVISLIVVGFVIGAVFQSKRTESVRRWPVGIDGKQFMFSGDKGQCQIITDFTPWPDFIPKGFTKYLVGTQSCPRDKPFSHLSADHMLTIECGDGEEASFTQSPNFFTAMKEHNTFGRELRPLDELYSPQQTVTPYKAGEPVRVLDETVVATCGQRQEVHMQNVAKDKVLERASHFKQSTATAATGTATTATTASTKPINILFMMIDALSRAHFRRALPKTFDRLQAIQDAGHSTVFQFMRYHSLKPFTDPNTIAMYTGYNSLNYNHEFDSELAAKHKRAPHDWTRDPLYFQSFRNDSYSTAWVYGFCEDWFQAYLFKNKPADVIDHELVLPFCSPEAYPPQQPFGNFAGPYSFKRRCMGNEMIHRRVFDYINQYWDNYRTVGKIVHATIMDAHEGTMDVIKFADDAFSDFVGDEMAARYNDTFMILVGDHGSHMGPYYLWAPGGHVEVAMPALYFVLPNWFLAAHPEVKTMLLANENKLSTPFLLYDTLRAFSKYPEFGGIDLQDIHDQRTSKGLLSTIPDDISCQDLGIPYDFCQC
ncbi:hypothetical protein SAMD00019534_000640, partial [Acytostelium subglobosum LB1]|uniref:hypothetical protein n=1 Tax=Acytostelium subglobosum LB1 TaxID=1410327 RepID=UPI000644832E